MVSHKINPDSVIIEQNGGSFNRDYLAYVMDYFYERINPNGKHKKIVGNRDSIVTFAESDLMLIIQDNKTILLLAINMCDLLRIYSGIKEVTKKGGFHTSTGYRWTWCEGYVDIQIQSETIQFEQSKTIHKKHQSCVFMLSDKSPLLTVIEKRLFSLSFNHCEISRLL